MSRQRTLAIAFVAAAVLAAVWLGLRSPKVEPGSSLAAPTLETKDEAKPAPLSALEPVVDAEPVRTKVSPSPPPVTSPASPGPAENAAMLVVSVVSKEDHAPVSHVRVRVHPSALSEYTWSNVETTSGNMTRAPISDSSGRIEMAVEPRVKLSISASDESSHCGPLQSEVEPLSVGERREIVLELPCSDDGHYFGRVLDRETRVPVSGASVQALHEKGWTQGPDGEGVTMTNVVHDARTDAAGRFELSFPSWTHPFLRIDREGYGLLVAPVHPGHERADQAEDILASRAASLHAHVVDAAGKAIVDASVVLKAKGYTLVSRSEEGESGFSNYVSAPDEKWSAQTDASGQCTVSELPPRVSLDVAILQGKKVLRRGTDKVELEPGQVLERTWTLGSGCRIEGVMVDQDRKPVARQSVLLSRREWPGDKYMESYESKTPAARTKTDDQGRFVLKDVAEGEWWLCPEPRNEYGPAAPDAIAARTQSVVVPDGGILSVTLSVSRGLYIRGTVVDPDGKPVKQAYISAQQSELWVGLQSHGGDDGAFALGPLAPGACSLSAQDGEHAASEAVEAQPGQSGVVLRLRRGGKISGRVVDAAGKGVKASVHVQPEHPHPTPMGNGFETNADEDGKFHLQTLEPDRYYLAFSTTDGRFATLPWVDAVADQETSGLVATLASGAKLTVHYEGKAGQARFIILLDGGTLTFPSYVVPERAETHVVPAAHLTLEYHIGQDGPARTMSIDVTAGETREVVLRDEG